MDERLYFMAYCIELYRTAHGLSGREVMDLFAEYGVMEYIERCYGALHVTGDAYILDDLETLVEERRSVARSRE